MCIIGIPEGEEREQETEKLSEKIRTENSNMVKKIDIQLQEVQRVSKKRKPNRSKSRQQNDSYLDDP